MKKIILIVGASGVGKDTLLRKSKSKIEANFITRYITRVSDKNEANFYVDKDAFELLDKNDFFISTWEAHQNNYAIAKNQIKDGLNIISISRNAIKDFERIFDNVITLEISLPKEMLYERLKNRNRESEDEIMKRINRNYDSIEAKHYIKFINAQSIELSIKSFIKLIKGL